MNARSATGIGRGVALLATSMLASPAALAQPGTASLMADNGALMVVQTGSTFQVVPGSVGSNWPTMQTFNFDMPDDQAGLARCRIHIIAWGDGSPLQGLLAHVSGSNGHTFTGQSGGPLNNVRQSTVSWTGALGNAQAFAGNAANAQSIITGAALGGPPPPQFMSATVASGTSGWGNYNLPPVADANQMRFVWNGTANTLGANPRNYRVATMPCLTVAKPVEPELPVVSGDHFQCYAVPESERLPPEPITLRDQFGRSQVVLGRAVMVCNPAVKTHGDKTYEVEHEDRHLVCYDYAKVPPRTRAKTVRTRDQFTSQTLTLRHTNMVCVPAAKRRLDGPDLPLK